MIPRIQNDLISDKLKKNKLLFINGPRRVGKQTLIEEIITRLELNFIVVNCRNKNDKKSIEEGYYFKNSQPDILIFKEAQHLENLTSIIENVLSGNIKPTVVFLFSFKPNVDSDLLAAIKSLGLEVNLFAPSFYESAQHFGLPKEEQLLEERLVYGNYPEVLADLSNAELTLREIIQEAVFTNLSSVDRINKGDKLIRMLQLLAFEMGNPISYNELAERCGLDNETVERYIKLLEDGFLLYRLPSYSNENRYELKKSNVVYFSDNGVRNALISNFNPLLLRNDSNELWKNYLISERFKWLRMNQIDKKVYFWRTHTNQCMDYLEIDGSQITAYKIDWEKRKKIKFPKSFEMAYPLAKLSVLNRSTYWKFLTQKN